jgi:hypothetical protein
MVIESPNQPQPNQNTDSDTESSSDELPAPSDVPFFIGTQSSQLQAAATIIQRLYRSYHLRSQFLNYLQTRQNLNLLSAVQIQPRFRAHRTQQQATLLTFAPTMSFNTDYEFPGGFKVAVNVAKPITNTDGNNAGRLYKKEDRPTEGSKEEKELLADIKVN